MNRIRTLSSFIAAAIAAAVVSGCASMAGVGGTSEYSCKAPEGVKCDSVSGTYYNSVENNMPDNGFYSIKANANGKYISARVDQANGPMQATAGAAGSWEDFQCE